MRSVLIYIFTNVSNVTSTRWGIGWNDESGAAMCAKIPQLWILWTHFAAKCDLTFGSKLIFLAFAQFAHIISFEYLINTQRPGNSDTYLWNAMRHTQGKRIDKIYCAFNRHCRPLIIGPLGQPFDLSSTLTLIQSFAIFQVSSSLFRFNRIHFLLSLPDTCESNIQK